MTATIGLYEIDGDAITTDYLADCIKEIAEEASKLATIVALCDLKGGPEAEERLDLLKSSVADLLELIYEKARRTGSAV